MEAGRGAVLGDFTGGRRNNMDALRLLASLLVVYSHSFIIVGKGYLEPPFYQNNYGALGVNVFFIISGLLITQSFLRRDSILRYLWARFLRIFPALIVVVLATVFIIGPLVTGLTAGAYFAHSETFSYLSNMTLYGLNYYLPGVFETNPFDTRVNAPLWTLEYEFTFYLGMILLGILGALKERRAALGIFLLGLVLTYFRIGESVNLYTLNLFHAIRFFTYFAVGMTAYLYRDSIPLNGKFCLLIIVFVIIGAFRGGFNDTLFIFMLAYPVLYLAYSPRIKLGRLTRYGDFSYGIYIWAWPVQQTIFYLFGSQMNGWLNLLIAGSIAVLLGAASWHLLEKRMLKLKSMSFSKAVRRSPQTP
ncbi:MAG: acyltransferase [Dehalococcoidales bacterium]|nr:acyltransferase [Dehalococcoidales bacterium]